MKTKEEQIESFLSEPIKKGEMVYVRGLDTQNKNSFFNTSKVVSLGENESIFIKHHNSLIEVKKGDYRKNTNDIGYNPFPDKRWDENVIMIRFNLESIIHSFYDLKTKELRKESVLGTLVYELEWEPFLINENGEEIVYQRDFCWDLKDKQLLIDSIYNGIDIGKILIRKRSWEWVESRVKQNKKASFKEIVDGKQRLKTIIEFINNEFPDLNGFYWDDLSKVAQGKFLSFSSVSYGEIGEKSEDRDVKRIFLNINFSGVQMSQEHIDFVKNINI